MYINKCFYCMEQMDSNAEVCPHCGKKRGEKAQPEFALPMGTILYGKYLIGTVLGQGGFGITYIGYDLRLNIKVAIKEYYPMNMAYRSQSGNVLWSSTGIPKETGCKNFLKEARKMAKLMGIPEIVRVLEIIQTNNTAYIVMDYVEGITLRKKVINDGPMSEKEIMLTFTPILKAMDKVHKLNIIHRDISPDNIMIDLNGNPKILDLGAAKEIDFRSDGDKQSSQLICKAGFSPPEQYTQNGSIGSWTDVYAMSATIYTCMTGYRLPLAMDRTYYNASVKYPDYFPSNIKKVLERGFAINDKDRYQTMGELLQALNKSPITDLITITFKDNDGTVIFSQHYRKADIVSPPAPPIKNGYKFNGWTPKITKAIEDKVYTATYQKIENKKFFKKLLIDAGIIPDRNLDIQTSPCVPSDKKEGIQPNIPSKYQSAKVGDIIEFGHYEDYTYDPVKGPESRTWRVLAKEADRILVISKLGIYTKPYNTEDSSVTWETCSLRRWLNENLLSWAFSFEEQQQIATVTVTADKNPYYATNTGNDTKDKLFLLSYTEAEKYFNWDGDRRCAPTIDPTDESMMGADQCWWWLRTPGCNSNYATLVSHAGSVYAKGTPVNRLAGYVRPAFWIKTKY